MSGIHAVDLKSFVTHSFKNVFKTMLSMQLAPEDPPNRQSVTTGKHIVGTVGFGGAVMGNVNIFVSREFAREMTAAMLGVPVEEARSDEEVNDLIGEVCNMVGGDLKSRLCDAGFTCSLSIPSITFGDSFRVESKGWDRHELIGFRCSRHSALLEVFVKTPN
jgi:chemotaxis protein CheX